MLRKFLPLILAASAVGCQKSGYTFTQVEGTVTQGGKPQPGVVVCFWPDTEAGTQAPRASAVTDAEGRYRLRCDEGTTGAVVGRYRVCVSSFNAGSKSLTMLAAPRPAIKAGVPTPPPLPTAAPVASPLPVATLPAKYASFKDTPLRDIEVKEGDVQTLDFEVASRNRQQ